jgi:hypothetical protein
MRKENQAETKSTNIVINRRMNRFDHSFFFLEYLRKTKRIILELIPFIN